MNRQNVHITRISLVVGALTSYLFVVGLDRLLSVATFWKALSRVMRAHVPSMSHPTS